MWEPEQGPAISVLGGPKMNEAQSASAEPDTKPSVRKTGRFGICGRVETRESWHLKRLDPVGEDRVGTFLEGTLHSVAIHARVGCPER